MKGKDSGEWCSGLLGQDLPSTSLVLYPRDAESMDFSRLSPLFSQPLWQGTVPTLHPLSTPADLWAAAPPSCKAVTLEFDCLLGG